MAFRWRADGGLLLAVFGSSLPSPTSPSPPPPQKKKKKKKQVEDLKVLKRSPDLLNNVKIGKDQLRLIIETYFVLPSYGSGIAAILVK